MESQTCRRHNQDKEIHTRRTMDVVAAQKLHIIPGITGRQLQRYAHHGSHRQIRQSEVTQNRDPHEARGSHGPCEDGIYRLAAVVKFCKSVGRSGTNFPTLDNYAVADIGERHSLHIHVGAFVCLT